MKNEKASMILASNYFSLQNMLKTEIAGNPCQNIKSFTMKKLRIGYEFLCYSQ